MRYINTMNTQTMLANAIEDQNDPFDGYFEVNRGEEFVTVRITADGEIMWTARSKITTEAGAAEVLARWAVEGI